MERYRINRPAVIHEILDEELVVVNLKSGAYFSLDPVGAVIWQQLDDGATAAEIAAELRRRYDAADGVVEPIVRDFLAALRDEDLISPHDGAAHSGNGTRTAAPAAAPRTAFAAPVLQKFTDMQDLLLLDPIHEADETGWPSRKP